jgi:hypothetical protein
MATAIDLRAIDKTTGVGRWRQGRSFQFGDRDCRARRGGAADDLSGVDLADLRDASLAINGKTWTVRNHG